MSNSLRTHIGRSLNILGLRKVARRIEQTVRPKIFRADASETPEAVERALNMAARSGLTDQGDYFEFGIYRGYTLWYAQKVMLESGNTSMRFLGFDSFQGFPEVSDCDAYKGDFSKGQFNASHRYVSDMMTRHGTDWDRTILVPGFFQDTLNDELKKKHSLRHAAVVLIDCVLYKSTRQALFFLRDLLCDGTIIVFDDWNAFDQQNDHGERRAFAEFLTANRLVVPHKAFEYGVYGKAFRIEVKKC
jgi:O-methyltransferase